MAKSRFQLVGSLLRPADLREYKIAIEHRDDIKYPFYDAFEGYKETETADIRKVIAEEKAAGIDVLTDGEYSKSMWHLDFVWGLKGIERYIADHGYTFQDHDGGHFETRKDIGIRITEPLSGKNHHFLDIYKLLKEEAGETDTKLTIWGPAHAYTEFTVFNQLVGEDQVYKTKEELKAGLTNAYKEFLKDQHYDRFFLEWDSEVAGDLKALESLKDSDAEVVLGLLSSKTTDLDDEERALKMLEEASQILPKDRLYLSHQCGFASCDSGNELSIPQQWAKIKQGQDIAAKFWS